MKRALNATVAAVLLTFSSAAWAKRPPAAPPVSGVVNLNTGTAKQLEGLPGIGPSRAKAIIAYRAQNHFLKVEDVRKVKGVGKGVFAKAHDHLAVSGPTTLTKLTTHPAAAAAIP